MKLCSVGRGRTGPSVELLAALTLLGALMSLLVIAPQAGALVFTSQWGVEGAGNGQFETPLGIAVSSNGFVYVADTGNDRIQQFDNFGAFIRTWGSFYGPNVVFNSPEAVAVDFAGNVLVADTGNNRIQKFDPSGNFLTMWGGAGVGNGRFSGPTGVATDPAGNVYVADAGNYLVQKFSSGGAFITQWGGPGTSIGRLGTMAGLGVDFSGNVYVADAGNNRIQVFDPNGAFTTGWGTHGTGDNELDTPFDVAVDSSGAVHVTDMRNHRIQTFTTTGVFLQSSGSQGSAVGQFRNPTGIAVGPSDQVFVADTYNHRVQASTPGTSIVVQKDSIPDDPQPFDFTNGGFSPSSFQLDDDGSASSGLPNRRGFSVAPGSGYSVTETVPPGWDQVSATCSDGSPVSNIDVAANEQVVCTFVNRKRATVVIVQDSQPNDPQDFSFTAGGGLSPTSFTLDDDGDNGNGVSNTEIFDNVVPGSGYSVSQSTPAGWGAPYATCSDGSSPGDIDVAPGETVTCTFENVNDTAGRIVVTKDAQPDDPQAFSFTAGGGLSPSSFQLDDDGNSANALSNSKGFVVAPGSGYSVAESVPAGWIGASATCSDGSPVSNIDVSPTETVTCTFVNQKVGKIVVKEASQPTDPQDFSFTAGGGLSPSSFQLDDDGDNGNALSNTQTYSGLTPTSGYSLSETAQAGWDQSATCSDGSPIANIDVGPGETVTCTFTNRKHGKIVVLKDARPNDSQDFSFTAGGGLSPSSFTLDDDGDNGNGVSNTQVFDDLSPRSGYSISESTPSDWALAAGCSDGSPVSNIDVAPAETVTCVFTNSKRASVTVVLDSQPDDPHDFSFTAVGEPDPVAFSLDDDGDNNNGVSNTRVLAGLPPQSGYQVTEASVPGWLQQEATCSDGSAPSSIDLAPGKNVTCTFVMSQKGRIVVTKDAQPDSAQAFDFVTGGGLSPSSFQLDDDGDDANGLSNTRAFLVDPGSGYSVAESPPPPNWSLSAACSDGSPTSNIAVSAGETVGCTFVNKLNGYARPRGASPLSASLVPAQKQCTAPTATHGGPLAFPSCPPSQASASLTLGTPDANGAAANGTGKVLLRVHGGTPGPPDDADVLLTASITDVRCRPATSISVCSSANAADGPDYSGQLRVILRAQLTDHSGGVVQTAQTFPFPGLDFGCANTTQTNIGGTCSLTTTFDSIQPGAVPEGERAIWELDAIQVFDGGPDGQVATPGNTLFMTQGVFVP